MASMHVIQPSPKEFHLSVVMERQAVPQGRWQSERWRVLGVVAGGDRASHDPKRSLIRVGESGEQYLWSGYRLELFRDEVESYYYNLLGRQPSVFVICRDHDGRGMTPVLTLLSHYEAEAYLEAGDTVFPVPMPGEIREWLERFILDHYVPGPGKGRKRERWDVQSRRAACDD